MPKKSIAIFGAGKIRRLFIGQYFSHLEFEVIYIDVVLRKNFNISKNTKIKFVEKPIFKQVMSLIDGINLTSIVKKHNEDYYFKAFKSKTQLITVLFGIY